MVRFVILIAVNKLYQSTICVALTQIAGWFVQKVKILHKNPQLKYTSAIFYVSNHGYNPGKWSTSNKQHKKRKKNENKIMNIWYLCHFLFFSFQKSRIDVCVCVCGKGSSNIRNGKNCSSLHWINHNHMQIIELKMLLKSIQFGIQTHTYIHASKPIKWIMFLPLSSLCREINAKTFKSVFSGWKSEREKKKPNWA